MKYLQYALGIIFTGAILFVALIPRQEWMDLLAGFGVAFAVYAIAISRVKSQRQVAFWLAIGVLARCTLIFTFPNLSDDVYRFIWDGHVLCAGINPYTVLPSTLITSGRDIAGISKALYALLNSQEYFTVYPPVDQGVFALGSWLGGDSWMTASVVMKCCIFCAEMCTLLMMYRILNAQNRSANILYYALNPLVIVELMGNLHFEALMIFGLVLAYFFMIYKKPAGIAGGLAIAIGAKLLPLMLVPLLVRRFNRNRLLKTIFCLLLFCIFLLAPMILGGSDTSTRSINLYFQSFEFNASFYYIGRWLGYLATGYNQIATIGPLMAGITLLALLVLFIAEGKPSPGNFTTGALFALTIYFLLATTVHPWYITTLVALSVFTSWKYPLIWSWLVVLSYSAYQTDAYTENLWLVSLQYVVLIGWMVYEILKHRSLTLLQSSASPMP